MEKKPRVSDRIQALQANDEWARYSREAPEDWYCDICQAVTPQTLTEAPQGAALRCARCNTSTVPLWLFDPRAAPDGKEESMLAVQVLQQHVIALRRVNQTEIYEAVRPYFNSGWCVRDILWAMERQADGEDYNEMEAWHPREPPQKLIWRLRKRLLAWRYADHEDGILAGGWAEMRQAMAAAATEQKLRQLDRDDEFALRRRNAANHGEPIVTARELAISAAKKALRKRREVDLAEAAAIAAKGR